MVRSHVIVHMAMTRNNDEKVVLGETFHDTLVFLDHFGEQLGEQEYYSTSPTFWWFQEFGERFMLHLEVD